ncbi:MAG: protein jag [Eubacterium sp.]|jgi:spoIIIJ-associated protein|nr:protein jag [Eubacterium sp.]NBI85639.1 protein jag [Lachnospiraceae bacterium]
MDVIEVLAKTYDEAVTDALIKLGSTSDQVEIEVIDKGSAGFLGIGAKPVKIKVTKKLTPESFLKKFLSDIFEAMHLNVEIILKADEEAHCIDIELKGEEMGVLIGKRGQTLDALQLLANNAAHKNFETYYKVKLDTENYRLRRKETLENLAKNIAYKVKRTKHSISLEPMNPFERRVIHSALQNDRYVITHSEGEDPFRHIVISYKK